jgi:hypothetical protein
MRIRVLLAMAAVAAITLIAPSGRAAANVCGGLAPRVNECMVEGFVITTDNPGMQVSAPAFLGVIDAKMTSETGSSRVTCIHSLDKDKQDISSKCYTDKHGTIFKGQIVTIVATATGKPGAVPAVGNWTVQYAAS